VKVDDISVIGFGGENFVKTTVRPSGVNVDAKTSFVDITPGANITAGAPKGGSPANSAGDDAVCGALHATSDAQANHL